VNRLAITSVIGVVVVLFAGLVWLWSPFAPSILVIRNVGNSPAQLVLSDASSSPIIGSGTLDPHRRKLVVVWFKDEGVPEIRCGDAKSRNSEGLDYVTPGIAIFGEIVVNGCDEIAVRTRIDPV
jgi:hypothetical protein